MDVKAAPRGLRVHQDHHGQLPVDQELSHQHHQSHAKFARRDGTAQEVEQRQKCAQLATSPFQMEHLIALPARLGTHAQQAMETTQ